MTETKTCKDCGEDKPLNDFGVNRVIYLKPFCKPCGSIRSSEWRKKNPERSRELQKTGQVAKSTPNVLVIERLCIELPN